MCLVEKGGRIVGRNGWTEEWERFDCYSSSNVQYSRSCSGDNIFEHQEEFNRCQGHQRRTTERAVHNSVLLIFFCLKIFLFW